MEHNKGTWVAAGARLQVLVPCTAGRFLSVQFNVDSGRSCDFDIMFEEAGDSQGAIRLYGPTRRATSVSTVVPIPQDGTAYVTWDNINSWWLAKYVSYTVCVSDEQPQDAISYSALAFGRSHTHALATQQAAPVGEGLPPAKPQELSVAAGRSEYLALDVTEGHSLELVFQVVQGSDIDFLCVLLPLGADGKPDEEAQGTRLYGPTRRTDQLHVKMTMPHSGSARLKFDAASSWLTSKLVRYTVDCRADESC